MDVRKAWNWIKDHIILIGIGILSIITLGKYTRDRINDRSTVNRDSSSRERETEIINQRIERTTELESEFIEECEEQLGAAEDTADRIEQSNITAEQAIAELRKRFAQTEDKE